MTEKSRVVPPTTCGFEDVSCDVATKGVGVADSVVERALETPTESAVVDGLSVCCGSVPIEPVERSCPLDTLPLMACVPKLRGGVRPSFGVPVAGSARGRLVKVLVAKRPLSDAV